MVRDKCYYAEGLCVWCLAMNSYYDVSKKVGPKKAMVKDLEGKLKKARDILDVKLGALNVVKSNVA